MNYQIGNFVKSGTGNYIIALMSLDGIEAIMKENEDVIFAASSVIIEPIEITDEWLLKFGFEQKGMCYTLEVQPFKVLSFFNDYLHIIDNNQDMQKDIVTLWNKDSGKKFYVHELQNILSIFKN